MFLCCSFGGSIGDLTQRLCTAAEVRFYFNSFFTSTSSKKTNYLKPNNNCNLSSWVSGCEPGWACSAGSQKVDLKNTKNIPARTTDCAACCEGFFCPNGITCMIRKFMQTHQMIACVTEKTSFCDICHNDLLLLDIKNTLRVPFKYPSISFFFH